MAPTFVRAASASGGEFDASITISFDATGCDYLSVGVNAAVGANNVTSPAISYNGVSAGAALVASTLGASNRARSWLFNVLGPATGTHNLVFTHSGSETMDRIVVNVGGYSGVDQTTPTGTAVAANGDSGTPSVTVSSATGELVVDTVSIAGSGTLSVGAGQTQRTSQANTVPNGKAGSSDEAGASSVVMSWSSTIGDEWGACGVSLKPASGGGTFGRLVGGTLAGGLLVGGLLSGGM